MESAARARCPTHDLVLGPQGECVLCRRTLPPPPSVSAGRRVIVGSVVGVALLASAIGAHALYVSLRPAPVEVRPEPALVASAASPPRSPEGEHPSQRPAPWASRPRSPRSSASQLEPEPGAAPSPAQEPEVEAGPSEAELAAARRRVSITMYSASWCGACAAARAYLRESHVRFTERDVDDSDRASERLNELNPRHTIPTFEIDDQVLVGFGPSSFESAVDQAAMARAERYR
jgi:glutaredoxin